MDGDRSSHGIWGSSEPLCTAPSADSAAGKSGSLDDRGTIPRSSNVAVTRVPRLAASGRNGAVLECVLSLANVR